MNRKIKLGKVVGQYQGFHIRQLLADKKFFDKKAKRESTIKAPSGKYGIYAGKKLRIQRGKGGVTDFDTVEEAINTIKTWN